jgi:dienelactone hydrolase
MAHRLALVGTALVVSLLAAPEIQRDVHGLTLVVRAADLHGAWRRLADFDTVQAQERLIDISTSSTSIRARVYAPVGVARQTVLLVPGLHPAGIDEPRLATLARRLAEANVTVVTPEIEELSRFEVTPFVTDRIEAAAAWLAANPELTPAGRIGLMGISFSGGLAISAAGRASLRNRLLYVFSFGGHDDLRSVVEYFCAGSSSESLPNDYGVAIVLLNVAERLVPADQLSPLRASLRRFLWASYIDRFDKAGAASEFAALREVARTLPEPAKTLLRYVNDRDVVHLGPRLRPYIAFYVNQSALSPALSAAPAVPIYVLHGRDDNVIPADEARRLSERLRRVVPVHLLITDLISHSDPDQPAHVIDVLKLAHFWGGLLAD